jgi:hypothetical protein
MFMTSERANQVTGGVWLIGLGLLFYTGFWWPGVLFVLGASAIVQGLVEGRGWYGLQGGLWLVGIGVWALFHFNIALFFVVLGASMVISALVRPPFLGKKPYVDNTLE